MTKLRATPPLALPAPAHGTGILTMVAAMTLVPMVDVEAKFLLASGLTAFQVVFLRMMCGSVLLAPLMLATRRAEIAPPQGWVRALLLGALNLSAGCLFFGALKFIPIADAVAISFVQPLFVVLLSRLVLKERVGASRWVALVVGFGATMLIIRPTHGGFDPGSLLALGSGLAMASYAILVKTTMSGLRRVSPVTVTFQTHLMACLVALPLILPDWPGLSAAQWGMALGMTLFGLAGQYLIVKAYALADASLVAPFAYIEIVTSTMVSWLFFRDMPDWITFAGVAILIISSVTLLRRGR